MSVSSKIIELFEKGHSPQEVIKMGYPKSTVYMVYKRYLRDIVKRGKYLILVKPYTDINGLKTLVVKIKELMKELNIPGEVIPLISYDYLGLIKTLVPRRITALFDVDDLVSILDDEIE